MSVCFKATVAAQVTVAAAPGLVTSELESASFLKEEQRKTLKAFLLDGKVVFAPLLTGLGVTNFSLPTDG